MSVERNAAVVGKQLILRTEYRFDRLPVLFDPDSFTKVEIIDSDGSTVLETITSANVIKDAAGKYHIVTSASWNTASKTVYDKWFIVKDGTAYERSRSTTIFTTAAPSAGIAAFVSLVKLMVQAPTIGPVASKLADPADYETMIKAAVKEYSKSRPDKKVVKLTGDGNAFFSLPSNWEEGFSYIRDIEYTIDALPPRFIESKFYRVDEIDTGLICRFYESGYPGVGEFFYFRYVIPHVVDASSSTIPEADKDAMSNLAASLCCQALAEAYGHTADATIDADAINYRSRGDEFASRAKELFKLYNRHVKPDITGLIGEWDIESYWEGNRNLLNKRNTMI